MQVSWRNYSFHEKNYPVAVPAVSHKTSVVKGRVTDNAGTDLPTWAVPRRGMADPVELQTVKTPH